MSRKPRIHTPGAVYHVILRGNAREDIFADDKDRYRFYSILQQSSERFDHRLHSFCLMTNHFHLEVQVGDVPLSRIMQNVALRYTQWFNWRHNRSGHLFEGRYKAIMVDADEYLLELAAYIHNNPVRAHITDRPEKYKWSSHRAYLGRETHPWLETSFILSQFSSKLSKARSLFDAFVYERVSDGRREAFHGERETPDSRILGDDYFIEAILSETEASPLHHPDVNAVISAVEKIYNISEERLASQGDRLTSEARAVAAWATLELSSGKLTELAGRVGRDASTMTSAVRRIEKRREKDQLLADKMEQLRQELANCSSPVLTP